MSKPKRYFAKDDIWSKSKENHLEYMRENGIQEMIVHEAVVHRNSNMFHCIEFGEIGETGDCCGITLCSSYLPRNGKSGICKHHRPCYEEGKEVKLTLNPQ